MQVGEVYIKKITTSQKCAIWWLFFNNSQNQYGIFSKDLPLATAELVNRTTKFTDLMLILENNLTSLSIREKDKSLLFPGGWQDWGNNLGALRIVEIGLPLSRPEPILSYKNPALLNDIRFTFNIRKNNPLCKLSEGNNQVIWA